ncbi:MAG: glycosyltransferase family 2 protein [Paludibacteraceae bacterium]|nr:glycosyltransferase family 2 protein [Paludibacteraceae bacterium]
MLKIIILNYNGTSDTTACLESLEEQSYQDFSVVVADNCSSEESRQCLSSWYRQNAWAKEKVHLIWFDENYGFARGNNEALKAGEQSYRYGLCLNNDTVLAKDCLERMVCYMEEHSEVQVLTPAIYYYDNRDILWNAGGRLVFGGRRYYGADQRDAVLQGRKEIDITFVTGCALMFRRQVCLDNGDLFTERFFFGEEDMDFSIRMRKSGVKMVCLTDAKLYHKVSASSKKNNNHYGMLFIHTLNRMINYRLHYSRLKYALWEAMYLPYMRFRFLRELSYKGQSKFIKLLKEESKQDGVSKEVFDKYRSFDFGNLPEKSEE